MPTIKTLLDNISYGSLALPAFQRGYVWKRPQVMDLMNSLYKGYPVGSLLTWQTRAEDADIRAYGGGVESGPIELLLDGQQRVTSLYGLMRGAPPPFFDGDKQVITGMYFHLENEVFAYPSAVRIESDPRWIAIDEIFASNEWMQRLMDGNYTSEQHMAYMHTIIKLQNIQEADMPIQSLTGEDKTPDVVVDIFNKVNSGGTNLTWADLTLARICAQWPECRDEMKACISKWETAGFNSTLDWLLRAMIVVVYNNPIFNEIATIDIPALKEGLSKAERAIDCLLETFRTHLFIDNDKLYKNKVGLHLLIRYVSENNGRFPDQSIMFQLLHWYLTRTIWGYFTGATDTKLASELSAFSETDLLETLRHNITQTGQGTVPKAENFDQQYYHSRFYTLLYIISRVHDARDWSTGIRLRHHSLGDATNLEMHHIFPKAYLKKHNVPSKKINNIGNIAFQTRETNRELGSRPPYEYMPEVQERWPGALESQWIPTDPALWHVENYQEFLSARRELLAVSATNLLESLKSGELPERDAVALAVTTSRAVPKLEDYDSISTDDELEVLNALNEYAINNELPAGEIAYELVHPTTEDVIAVLDLAWPQGLQIGYSAPVAVLIEEDHEVVIATQNAGYRVFTSGDAFKDYINLEIIDHAPTVAAD
jgi:hypothetical protein